MTAERIANIAAIAECTPEEAENVVCGEWSNAEEHAEWLKTATDEQIGTWVYQIARDVRDGMAHEESQS